MHARTHPLTATHTIFMHSRTDVAPHTPHSCTHALMLPLPLLLLSRPCVPLLPPPSPRARKWVSRQKSEGPKKIEDVHREAAQQRLAQVCVGGGGVCGLEGRCVHAPGGYATTLSTGACVRYVEVGREGGGGEGGREGKHVLALREASQACVVYIHAPGGQACVVYVGMWSECGYVGVCTTLKPHAAALPAPRPSPQERRDRDERMNDRNDRGRRDGGRDGRGGMPEPGRDTRMMSRDELPTRTVQVQRSVSTELNLRPPNTVFGRPRWAGGGGRLGLLRSLGGVA